MPIRRPTSVLLTHCEDQPGIIAATTEGIRKAGGNILDLDQHVDREAGRFFMRVSWESGEGAIPSLEELASRFGFTWALHHSEQKPKLAIFVSKEGHCLYDLLSRVTCGELNAEVVAIVGNHRTHEAAAERFGVPFHHIPVTPENKPEAEAKQITVVEESGADTVVLARYMQILSDKFVDRFTDRIINIHHSFLPAFAGAKPYHAAHQRGVKIIGATSHYVTAELDAGPIIHQDVTPVTHQSTVKDLIRRGRDLERTVLARAVWLHTQHRVLSCSGRTTIFG